MARKPNSMRSKKVATATKKKTGNSGKAIPNDVSTKYKVASRKPRTRRA